MPRVSIERYAQKRGCEPSAVRAHIDSGKITAFEDDNGKRWIEPELADREWNENVDAAMARGKRIKDQVDEELPITLPKPGDEPVGRLVEIPVTQKVKNYNAARAEREHFNAELARLKFEEQAGKLIDAAAVEAEQFKIGRQIRDAMLSIPDRIASELAGIDSQFKIHARLTDEIKRALEQLKEGE